MASLTIGNDILDIGSRKAESRARRPRVDLPIDQFNVPHVPNVSDQLHYSSNYYC